MINSVNKRLYGERKRSVANVALNVILIALAVILAVEIFFGMIFTGIYVSGDSMLPTLNGAPVVGYTSGGNEIFGRGGDYIYVNKYAVPKRGDIVVVYDKNKRKNIIKRVLALGGDTVAFNDGVFYLNGDPFVENYVSTERNTEALNNYYNMSEREVEKDCMFLVGDNRDRSDDSRNEANGDYEIKCLVGVVPQWSLNIKKFSSYWYTFFNYTLHGQ